jgi:hypothetical protein
LAQTGSIKVHVVAGSDSNSGSDDHVTLDIRLRDIQNTLGNITAQWFGLNDDPSFSVQVADARHRAFLTNSVLFNI